MNQQQLKGSLLRARGSLESLLGRLTGSRKQDAKGVAHQAEGAVRHGIGDVRASIDHAPDAEPKTP